MFVSLHSSIVGSHPPISTIALVVSSKHSTEPSVYQQWCLLPLADNLVNHKQNETQKYNYAVFFTVLVHSNQLECLTPSHKLVGAHLSKLWPYRGGHSFASGHSLAMLRHTHKVTSKTTIVWVLKFLQNAFCPRKYWSWLRSCLGGF